MKDIFITLKRAPLLKEGNVHGEQFLLASPKSKSAHNSSFCVVWTAFSVFQFRTVIYTADRGLLLKFASPVEAPRLSNCRPEPSFTKLPVISRGEWSQISQIIRVHFHLLQITNMAPELHAALPGRACNIHLLSVQSFNLSRHS